MGGPTDGVAAVADKARKRTGERQAREPADFLVRPDDWPETRYERKARRQGHEVWYFRYIRR